MRGRLYRLVRAHPRLVGAIIWALSIELFAAGLGALEGRARFWEVVIGVHLLLLVVGLLARLVILGSQVWEREI